MGNKQDWVPADNSFPSQEDLLSNLYYIEQGEMPNEMLAVGKFNIYRFKKSPYQLIMKQTRTFSPDNPKQQEYSRMAKVIASRIHHKNIAKIHSINICSSICTKQVAIESYVNYYAINLQQIIQKRKINDTRFTSQEVWYMLHSLIEVSSYLKKRQIYFGVYLARNVYLSHEGYLKIYLYHLNSSNNHILYYHMMKSSNRDLHRYLPIPPQCLPFLKEKTQQLKHINLQKLDVFGIGMIALEAILFNSTRKYYSSLSATQHSFVFDQNLLKKDVEELKDIYPTKLINLLQKMVKTDPKDRFSFEQVRNYINSIRVNTTMNGSIKMVDDQQNPIEPKISYRPIRQVQQYNTILKNITQNQINGESKLRFVPLRQISREKYKNTAEQCNISQMGLSVQTTKKKKKRLSLSKEKKKREERRESFLDCTSASIFRC